MNSLLIKPLYIFPRFPLQCAQGLITPQRGFHTVQSDFFTSMISPMGGMWQRYNTRKGKPASLRFEVFSIPPARLKTGKTQNGVSIMRKISPSASAQSTDQSPELSPRTQAAHASVRGAL